MGEAAVTKQNEAFVELAETIKAAAKVCRFCSYRFDASDPADALQSPGSSESKDNEADAR